ncbi:MAG: hydantoinase B/oxoprolinase family protein [Chloroflexi bacterium]|nr:hydantoinase B/oxoprolinase family protein [Chloroflexota bacterium]
MTVGATVDPVTLEVLKNALYAIADEMNATLMRTAYSTNIKDRRDCSSGVYAADGQVVAQTELGTPLHLGLMNFIVRRVLATYPAERLAPGDQILFNTPYPDGPGHLNDTALVTPVFDGEVLIAVVCNLAHHVDVGGFAPGSMPFGVHEIYQEGLQIPPTKIVKRGELDEEIVALISQNLRTPYEFRGDLMAQLAANAVGRERVLALVHRYGAEGFRRATWEIMDYSERRMRSAIGELPPGRYSFEDYLEGDGLSDDLVKIAVTITVERDRLIVDFAGTSPQVRGPINCRPPSVYSCVYYAVKAVVDPGLPPNAGAYRPIEVIIPEGSLLAARYPAAVCNSNIVTTMRLADVMLGAFAQAVPERVVAGCSGSMNLFNIGGVDLRTGLLYSYVETYGGGQGALHDADGMDGVHSHMTNTRNAPVEVIEATYPLFVRRYGLVSDSDGPGRYRGGLGMTRELTVLSEGTTLTVSADRCRLQPWGLDGGHDGAPGRNLIERADGSALSFPSAKVTTPIAKGDTAITVTPGGGGWGNPKERDPRSVAWDVREGFVSPQRARDLYGVVVDPRTGEIDQSETTRLRGSGTEIASGH